MAARAFLVAAFFGGDWMTIWVVAIIGVICVIALIAEAYLIIPDKLPLGRKKEDDDDQSDRSDW